MRVGPKRKWGTWEELILGGAVIRHGTQDWNVVATELRARTVYPYGFTPEACKAKYEDLQRRYSGCTAWFEELRKRRVAELKRDLEKSEDSIGSLESKLESLKAEKGIYTHVDYNSSQTESPLFLTKTEVVESSCKEGLSAGSFTLDSCTPAAVSHNSEPNKTLCIDNLAEACNEQQGTLRKRRGKRKRKDCSGEVKEGSIGEISDNLGSTNVKESSEIDGCDLFRAINSENLMEIFNSIAENKHSLCFRRRLDSQKRARYKKIIRQHMDFDTIRSRIGNRSIKTSRELFRDLLLLANNALVFYSRRTREQKSALSLRDFVTKAYHSYHQHHSKELENRVSSSLLGLSTMMCKPRSARPRPSKPNYLTKVPESDRSGFNNLGNCDSSTLPIRSLFLSKRSDGDSGNFRLQSLIMGKRSVVGPDECSLDLQLAVAKRGFGRTGKAANHQTKTPVAKERKRARQRS